VIGDQNTAKFQSGAVESLAKRKGSDAIFVVSIFPAVKKWFRRAETAVSIEANRLVNRLRHAKLKRRVSEQLGQMARPRRILLVCNANLCRSPYLAAALRRSLPDVEIESAGLFGAGRQVQSQALASARERGVDLSSHRSRLLNAAMLERADLIIVMEPRQARLLASTFGVSPEHVVVAGDLDSDAAEPRMIVDPWGRDAGMYAATFARLERCALQLLLLLPPAKR
jgi:protein-tyrosine phosphatase